MALSIKIKPLILVGSEGSGKTAISFHLLRKFPHKFQRVISHTTRKPRHQQKQKQHYYFVNDNFVTENLQKFVTLTKSPNDHYYGLLGEQITRVIGEQRIPIIKMTLQAYKNNISSDGSLQIKQQATPVQIITNVLLKNSYLTRNKSIQCNALYITVPDLSQLQKRLRMSPFDQKQQNYRIQRATKQQKQSTKYFQQRDVIKSEQDMDETIKAIQSRLFELY